MSGLQEQALQLPKEHEMPARDKYTTFSKWDKGYRKGIHKVPKFTRVCGCPMFGDETLTSCCSSHYGQIPRVSDLSTFHTPASLDILNLHTDTLKKEIIHTSMRANLN